MAVLKDFYADKLRVRVFDTRQVMENVPEMKPPPA